MNFSKCEKLEKSMAELQLSLIHILKEHLPKVEYTTEGDSLHMDLCMPAAPCCAQQLPCFHHLARADIGVLQMGVK